MENEELIIWIKARNRQIEDRIIAFDKENRCTNSLEAQSEVLEDIMMLIDV